MNFLNFILFILFLWTSVLYAFPHDNHYLWIEFEEGEKERDGAITLPLQIHFGRFTDQRQKHWRLDSLRAYYALVERNVEEERNFYELPIERHNGILRIKISSWKSNRFMVFVRGVSIHNGIANYYCAKTSFVLFGQAPFEKKKEEMTRYHSIDRKLELHITPEFNYWPQTGNPVIISAAFNGKYLPEKILQIYDENTTFQKLKTSRAGNVTYIPPHDKKLNRKGINSFKHNIIVVRESKKNTRHVFSYTLLLHRSRFAQKHTITGLVLFGVIFVLVFSVVLLKRKSFAL